MTLAGKEICVNKFKTKKFNPNINRFETSTTRLEYYKCFRNSRKLLKRGFLMNKTDIQAGKEICTFILQCRNIQTRVTLFKDCVYMVR